MTHHDLHADMGVRPCRVLHADRLRLGGAMHVAFAAILAYGTLNAVLRESVTLAIGVALVAVTVAIFVVTLRIGLADRLGLPAYLGLQAIVVTASMVLGRGIVTLHYTPLIAQAALVCRRRTLVVMCCALGIESLAIGQYFQRDLVVSLIELVGFAALAGFTVMFAASVAAEREARATAEQLATMRERNRVAREIHDSLGHYLTVIHLQLEIAGRSIGSDPDAAATAVGQAKRLTHEGLEDVRRSVAALRAPAVQDRPLPEAIKTLVERLAGSITFDVRGTPCPLPPVVALALFRTAQEALTNAEKHAGATRVGVELVYEPDSVELVVHDDGRGDARGGDAGPRGFGLLGVQERVALLGGSLQVTTRPGEGFRVRVAVPLA